MPCSTLRVHSLAAILVGIAVTAVSREARAGDTYSAELGIGGEYDSNIAVEELDASTSQSDYALTLTAGVGMQQKLSDIVEFGLTYDYDQSIYNEFSHVDRQTHIVGSSLNMDFNRFDTGVSLFYIHSRLDGDAFLELYRASPSISGFLSKKWFARAAYVYSEKVIEDREERDATTHAGESDVYYFRRGLRSYFNLGYRFKDEDANADRYDYTSHALKLRYVQRIELLSRMTKLELSWRYEDRDYSSITPSIAQERDDNRNRWRADYEIPLTTGSIMQFYYGYADYESNLPSADYDQVISGMRYVYRW